MQQRETIARYVDKLVVALYFELELRGLGTRRRDLLCHRVDKTIKAMRVGMATPVRDIKLSRLLCDKIETIAQPSGMSPRTHETTGRAIPFQ